MKASFVQKVKHKLKDILKNCNNAGFNVQYKVLNSKNYGTINIRR